MADYYILVSSASVLSEVHGCPRSQNANHSFEPRRLSILSVDYFISLESLLPHPHRVFTMYVSHVKDILLKRYVFFVTSLPQSP